MGQMSAKAERFKGTIDSCHAAAVARTDEPCGVQDGAGTPCPRGPVTHVWRWGLMFKGTPDEAKSCNVCDHHAQCLKGDECDPLPGHERRTKGSPGWRDLMTDEGKVAG